MEDLFRKVSVFFFDMDGVLTDGTVWVMPERVQMRRMSIRDGYALQLAVKLGYRIVIVSGGNSVEAKDRLEGLGITEIFMSVVNKKAFMMDYLQKNELQAESALYMGDDIPDLDALKVFSLSCCPANAAEEVIDVCSFVSSKNGGDGCVREVIENVLKARGHWLLNSDTTSA